MIVAQKLARRIDGGVIAFRAWKVFDQETRRRLAAIPYPEWASVIRAECNAAQTDFEAQVKRAFHAGHITFETAREVASLTPAEARELLNVKEEERG